MPENVMKPDPDQSVQPDMGLVEQIIADDADAFGRLFRKYYESLYRFAGRFTGDAQIAESIVQEIFVRIWERRKNWTIHSSVKSYLYTAVRNQAINVLKHEKRTVSVDESPEPLDRTQSPEERLFENEIHEAVTRAIEKLPERTRQVYLLRRYDQLSYAEIAENQNISVNTVKTQMRRALKTLRKHLSHLLLIILRL